jgi:hypothetical protein
VAPLLVPLLSSTSSDPRGILNSARVAGALSTTNNLKHNVATVLPT